MIDHPITPPPELIGRWEEDWHHSKVKHIELEDHIANEAAQWGADQELEACCAWLSGCGCESYGRELCAARRPKPPTLNSIALQMLGTIERDAHYIPEITDTIRRALNELPDN
jgi:hypothetical protein